MIEASSFRQTDQQSRRLRFGESSTIVFVAMEFAFRTAENCLNVER
jgi:hypothetical protein